MDATKSETTLRRFNTAVRALATEAGLHGTVIVQVSMQSDGDEQPERHFGASIHRGNYVVANVTPFCRGSESMTAALAALRSQLVEDGALPTLDGDEMLDEVL